MRNLIILFICALILTSCSVTRIAVDRYDPDGRRLVMTSPVHYNINDVEYGFSIKAYEYEGNIDWYLVLSSGCFMSDSSKILLKLGNQKQTIYYFPCTNVTVSKRVPVASSVSVGKVANTPLEFNTFTDFQPIYHYMSDYNITPNQLEKISRHKIRKIRIAPSPDYEYLERVFMDDLLGQTLGRFYRKIKQRLKKPLIVSDKNNFYDDF